MPETTTEWSFDKRIIRHHFEFEDEEEGTNTHRLDTSSDLHFEGWQIFITGFMIALLIILCGICYSYCKNKINRFRRRIAPIPEEVKEPEPDPITNEFSSDDPATTAVFGHPMTARSWKAITPKLQRVEESTDSQSEDETDMVAEMEGNADEGNAEVGNGDEDNAEVGNGDEENDEVGNGDEDNAEVSNGDEGNADFCNAYVSIADKDNVDKSNRDEDYRDADNLKESKESIADIIVESISDESEWINEESVNGLDVEQITEQNQAIGQELSGGRVTERSVEKKEIDDDEGDIEEAIDVVNIEHH